MFIIRFLNGNPRLVMAPDEQGGSGGGGEGGGDADAGDAGQDGGGADKGAADAGSGNEGNDDDADLDNGGDGDDDGAADGGADSGGKKKPAESPASTKDPKGKAKAGEGQGAAEFPADWREQLAIGADGKVDAKALANLKRLNSPKDLYKSYTALRQRIDSGEYKKPLGKDAKPEEVAAWRKDNGIPEKPEGYLSGLPEGLVFGDEDKAALTPFLEDMHSQNANPATVHAALDAYTKGQAQQVEAIQQRDLEIAADTEDELRAEWQGDYRGNITAVNALIDSQFPAEVKQALLNARLGDEAGTPLMHSPHILRAFASMGRYFNPQSTNTNNQAESMDTVEGKIKEYENRMKTDRKNWFKDEKAQNHYRELLEFREKHSKAAGK